MNIDTQIIYVIILILSCLLLICISLMYLYMDTRSKYIKTMTDILNKKASANDSFNTDKIIEKSDRKLEQIASQIVSKWTETASIVIDKNAKLLDSNLQKKIQEIYKKDDDNFLLYKKARQKEFDKLVTDEVNKLSKEIINREIDAGQHKKLIIEGLERAKENGLFGWYQNSSW